VIAPLSNLFEEVALGEVHERAGHTLSLVAADPANKGHDGNEGKTIVNRNGKNRHKPEKERGRHAHELLGAVG